MTSFGFPNLGETGTITGKEIKVTVPYGTDVRSLIAGFELSPGASASIRSVQQASGVTVNDFTNPVTLVVKAANGNLTTYTVTVSDPDLFFAFGLQTSSTNTGLTIPAYMRRGQLTLLPLNGATRGQTAVVTPAGSDVYVPGWVLGTAQQPVVWKISDTTVTTIDLKAAYPNNAGASDYALAFQVYIDASGNRYTQGTYYSATLVDFRPGYWVAPGGTGDHWVDLKDFSGGTSGHGVADGNMVVHNGAFYVTGWMKDTGGYGQPVYWKDGTPTRLPYNSTAGGYPLGGYANDLTVVGSDYYMNGRLYTSRNADPSLDQFVPVVWHWVEGQQVPDPAFLPTGSGTTLGTDWGLMVDGSDLYAFGMLQTWATELPAYWKNSGSGWQLNTPSLPAGTAHGHANWLHPVRQAGLAGDDAYMDGCFYTSQGYGLLAYLLNGEPITIPIPAQYYGVLGENMSLVAH